jgi:shikimate kinase
VRRDNGSEQEATLTQSYISLEVGQAVSQPNIILTGFMGTGKSTVGRLLAERLGYNFVDTDTVIQSRSGQSIAEIFEAQGEAAFRNMEAALAQELGRRQAQVIATGGGMMLDAGNAAALMTHGRAFCLKATPEDIIRRLGHDHQVRRPLLEVPDPTQHVRALLAEREAGYRRFRQIDTSGKSPQAVVDELLDIIGPDVTR